MNADPLVCIDWPENPTVDDLADAVGRTCGLNVVLTPIPPSLRHAEVSGLTVTVGSTAHIYYDSALSPINQVQTVMHEYAHILLGDVCVDKPSVCHRTTFDDPKEQKAELTGMRLMFEIRRRRRVSDLLDFFSGGSGIG